MKQTLLCFLILFFYCCIIPPSHAHNVGLHTSRLSVEEGLSQSAITAITQDKYGFIWIGTLQGLNRYDGNTVTNINTSANLNEQEIVGLFPLSENNILVSTRMNGAFLLDINSYKTKHIYKGKHIDSNGFPIPITTAIPHKNNILFSINSVLYSLNLDTLRSRALVHLDADKHIRAITLVDNFVAVGTTEGLFTYSLASGQLTEIKYNRSNSELSRNVKLLKKDSALGLLVGTVEGLFVVPLSKEGLVVPKSYKLVSDKNIWGHQITPYGEFIATEHGLYSIDRTDKSSEKVLSLTESKYHIADPSITQLYADKHHNLWLGTHNSGVYFWPSNSLRFRPIAAVQDKFTNNNIWSITTTDNRTILLGTENGINEVDARSHQFITTYLQNRDPKAIYGSNAVFTVMKSQHLPTQTYLIQSASKTSLFNTKTRKIQHIPTPDGTLFSRYGWGMAKYSERYFPFISSDGYYEYDAKDNIVRKLIGLSKQLPTSENFLMLPPIFGDNSNYWISTDQGLLRYNKATNTLNTVYQPPNDSPSFAITSWRSTSSGQLWLATSTQGLIQLNQTTFETELHLTTKQGLPSNTLYTVLIDTNGIVWSSSQRGLIRFDPTSKNLQIFAVPQGLPSSEFNSGAAATSHTGELLFGTVNGAVQFNPDQFLDSSNPTRNLRLTQIDVLSQQRRYIAPNEIANALDFKFDDMGIELQFSDFNFNAYHQPQYQALLNGKSHSSLSNLEGNKLFLNQVAPGNYTLAISARSMVNDNSQASVDLEFSVAYSPWRSPLSITLYCLAAALLLVFFVIKHKQKQRQLKTALKAVTQASEQTKLALHSTQSGVWSANISTKKITQQRALALGFEGETMTLQEHYNAIHPDDREIVERAWRKFIANPTKEQLSLAYRLRCDDDNWHWFHDFGQVAEFDASGKAIELHGIYTNVTTQKAHQMRANMLGEAFSQVNDWILILDPRLQPISVNSSFCKAFQLQEDEALSALTAERFINAIGEKRFQGLIGKLKSLGPNQYLRQEVQVTDSWDNLHPVQLSISAVSKDNITLEYFVVVVTDLTEQKKAENELRYLANYDALTQLPNRSLMLQHIEFAIFNASNSHQSCALLFLDLDRFKPINDAYGHRIGDKLLIAITNRIQEQLCDDCILARQSGDEFLILIKSFASIEIVSDVVKRLVQRIPERIEIDGITMSVSASIGIAVYPFDAPDSDTLIRNADIAMIHAKQSGRNAFKFFTESMNAEISKKLNLETAMKTAVKGNAFFNHYQPIINTTTGHLAGVELLLRWDHDGERIPPSDFIPIAEENGLIEILTEQALLRALSELRPLFEQSPNFYLSINLSAVHILRSDIAYQFSEVLQAHGLTSNNLRLEITESIFMSDLVKARATINEMKRANFVLLLDDFGTGFSSLTYLNEFPLDFIKIDQGFVRNMTEKPANKSIIRTIHLLAQSLNMKCIAEGVENEHQLSYLRDVGCEYMQGYFFAKPMAIKALLEFYTQHESARA
ncbi:EAL domain-containing protein [Pseudoalteromonas sp. PS5]|uniref:EAL domain-containing protein n=1 Tax=Pseudoalteromonas sp. PS5 TaxID=1437473 RepID=UPI000FFE5D6C|nr:EAL domain-containing protein [Pseudoalteromonas sp. PS5]RXE95209.1 EAL domain-containing protein [Pseudoalteromonas sp. PS5]